MNLPNGHLLQNGKYRLSSVVGQGGFGITYRGVWYTEVKGSLGKIKTEVPVCIKEYFFKDYCYRDNDGKTVKVHSETGALLFDKFKEKLIKEARILSEVHHPYIVNVLEVFEENGTAYIAMEYINGHSLKERMETDGILSEDLALKYIHQIGLALSFVHKKNILHLDIKPSNILIDKNDNARLIDFGVSRRYDIGQQETSTTMLTLSKGFASIEQYDSEGMLNFSPRPDIYSLGATLYYLLTGKVPTESILRTTHPLQNPSVFNTAISKRTEDAILKAMQVIPTDRFATVNEMLEALGLDATPLAEDTQEQQSPDEGDDDETTVIYKPSDNKSKDVDAGNKIKEEKNKKKSRKIRWLLSIFAIFAMLIVASLVTMRNKWFAGNATSTVQPSMNADNHSLNEAGDSILAEPSSPVQSATDSMANGAAMARNSNAAVGQTSNADVKEDDAKAVVEYNKLLALGKSKMKSGDFAGAKRDFTNARNAKLTEEVVRLIIQADSKMTEKNLSDKKALYEEKMNFGKLKIVRRKGTGLYGAIDSDLKERIPCKYLSVGIADNGRAFERADHLFDIYNTEGVLISEGATGY
jgi:serine/threonine protein kinase